MLRAALLGAASVFGAGCGTSAADRASSAVRIDTLPGGMTVTISSSPIDSGHWRLVAVRDIQPPELDSAELGNPRDIALADDGSVLVSESSPTVIRVFDENGLLSRQIGRQGQGPGEFQDPFIALTGDTLVAQDPAVGRATTFNWRTGAVLSERRTACCYFSPIAVDGANRAVVRMMTPPDSTLPNVQAFVRFPVNGTDADSVRVPSGNQKAQAPTWLVREGNRVFMSLLVPYQPRAFHVVDPRGGFVTAYSSDYQLIRTSTGRDTVGIFGRTYTPVPVSAADKSAIVEQRVEETFTSNDGRFAKSTLRAAFDANLIPNQRPAFEGVWIDRVGRTWLQVGTRDSAVVQLDVFDEKGRWLDALTVPAASWPRSPWRPISFARDEVAVLIEGDDGRPLVRVFRIERR